MDTSLILQTLQRTWKGCSWWLRALALGIWWKREWNETGLGTPLEDCVSPDVPHCTVPPALLQMGIVMGPVSAVEKAKYDGCVTALKAAPVGVDGLMGGSSNGSLSFLSCFMECSVHIHVLSSLLSLVCILSLDFFFFFFTIMKPGGYLSGENYRTR